MTNIVETIARLAAKPFRFADKHLAKAFIPVHTFHAPKRWVWNRFIDRLRCKLRRTAIKLSRAGKAKA